MLPMTAGGLVRHMLWKRLASSWLVIALIAGTAGGLTTGLVAGASRTSSAAERFLAETRLLDLMVTNPELTVAEADEVRRLPGVDGLGLLTGIALFPRGSPFVAVTANVDGRWGVDVDVPRLVRGRLADPEAADELVLTESMARLLEVDVGDTVRFDSWSPEQFASWSGREPTDEEAGTYLGPTLDLEVVGVTRHPVELTTDDPTSFFTALPPAFWRTYEGTIAEFGFRFLAIDLGESPSADTQATVANAVREIVGPESGMEEAGELSGQPVLLTLDFVATAMLALALATGLAGLIVGGLLIVRTATRAADETAELRSLGMTGTARGRAVTAAAVPSALAAAALTLIIAVASSALVPFGLAGKAEPHPGLHFDTAVVLIGAAATGVLVLVIAAAAAMRTMRRRPVPAAATVRTRSRLAELGLPVGPLCGLDLVLGSGRRGRGVNQAAVVGTALAAMAGAGALVLTASTDHLFATPRTFGWTWDYTVPAEVAEHLVADPAVESVGIVHAGPLSIDGRATVTRGIQSLKGELPLLLVDGRHAEPGEVVLGTRTMDDLGVEIGDTVVANGSNLEDQELRVVGAGVFAGVIDVPEAGRGAAMPLEELTRVGLLGQEGDTTGVLTMAAGADREAFARRITEETGDAPVAVRQPVELARLHEIEAFPLLLAAFLTGIGLVAMAHALVMTTRRRRSDMAVLRALGLARRGVYQAVSTQAVVLAVLGACIGVPLGIAAGQALWRGLARSLGLVVVVDVPWPLILGAAALAAATLGVLALIPARGLVRTRPAVTLRSE